jgi:hypothetical protein
MIPVEVHRFVGVASVEEVCKKFSLLVIKSKIMLLENNGFAANDMLFNINGFSVDRWDKGLKARFSVCTWDAYMMKSSLLPPDLL